MQRRRLLWGLCGAAMAACWVSYGAGIASADAGRERLAGVRAAYRGLKSFSCEMTVTTSSDAADTPPFKADVAIRFPDRAAVACGDGETAFRAVGGPSGRQVRVLNGAATPQRDAKPATIADVLRDARLESTVLAQILSVDPLPADSDAVTDEGTTTGDGGAMRRLTWKRKGASGTESVTLEIGEKDSLLRRAIVTTGEGAAAFKRTETYSAVAANPDLPDALFALVAEPAPEGKKKFDKPVRDSIPEKQRRQIFDAGAFNPLDRPEIVRDFTLKNVSARPLTIRRIESGCGCTTALLGAVTLADATQQTTLSAPGDAAAQLPAGAETAVRVTLRTATLRRGDFGKSVTVWADGAPQPIAQLTISGEILPAVSLPPAIDFGPLPTGKGAEREIRVPVDRRIVGATAPTLTSDGPQIKAALLDRDETKSDIVIFRYRVTLPQSAPLGLISETLTLTPAPDAPQSADNALIWKTASTLAGGTVTGDIAAAPQSLNFGLIIGGRERSLPVTLIYANGKPDVARKIAAIAPYLRVTPGKMLDGKETLTITILKDAPTANFHSSVTVTLSNGQVLVIPVMGYVQGVAPANAKIPGNLPATKADAP